SRFARERLPPRIYLAASYYQRWALAMETNVIERGYAGADELSAGHALRRGKPLARKLTPDVVKQGMTRGSFYRQAQAPARFQPGRSGADEDPPPAPPPPPAALRTRTSRRGRTGARLPRLSGYDGHRQGRQPAMALHRRVRGQGAVGPGRRPDRQDLDRCVRA